MGLKTCQDTPGSVDVMAKDMTYPDDSLDMDSLSLVGITQGANGRNGVCTTNNDGRTVLYTPNPGYVGLDRCGYTTCDSSDRCRFGLVRIRVYVYGSDECPITLEPTLEPTPEPTPSPTNEPTKKPVFTWTLDTLAPTTLIPTYEPTPPPSPQPTDRPSFEPTPSPSVNPTPSPSS